MAYRITTEGMTVECDTAAEVAELRRLFVVDNGKLNIPPAPRLPKPKNAPDYERFWRELDARARRVVTMLLMTEGPVKTGELAETLTIPATEIKYIVRTVRSTAQKVGLSPELAIRSEATKEGKKQSSQYFVDSTIVKAMTEAHTKVLGNSKE